VAIRTQDIIIVLETRRSQPFDFIGVFGGALNGFEAAAGKINNSGCGTCHETNGALAQTLEEALNTLFACSTHRLGHNSSDTIDKAL